MKLTAVLLLVVSLHVAAKGFSQTLTLHQRNATLTDLFKSITKQTGYSFMYRDELLNKAERVDVSVTNASLKQALDACLQGQPFVYTIVDKVIVIDEKKAAIAVAPVADLRGQVVNEKNEPLPGASVVIKGTTKRTTTNEKGEFLLHEINLQDAELVVDYIGYEREEIKLGGRSSVTVNLKQKNSNLTDVVVVGYATQKRVNMTGAVSSIGGKSLDDRPVTNVSSALAGLSPGLQVQQASGKPGSDKATLRIRGVGTLNNSDPLVVIDGIVGVMDAVNPNDIESISVLKDAASASIYGSLAANGVILITTKKGSRNKTTVTYSGMMSTTQPTNMPAFVNDYVRYMNLYNESARNLGQAELFSQSTINTWTEANKHPNDTNAFGIPNSVAYSNTDWSDVVFQHNLLQNHNVSVSGGGDKVKYLMSLGYLNNPGVMENTGTERYQLRLNLDSKVNDFLSVGTQTFASMQSFGMGNTDNAFNYLRQTTPGVPPRYQGKFGFPSAIEESATANNILLYLNNVGGDDAESRFNSTVYATLHLLKGLTFETRYNYQLRFRERNSFDVPYDKWDFTTNVARQPAATPDQLTTSYYHDRNYTSTIDNVLRYTTQLPGGHDITALAGYNQNYYYYTDLTTSKKGLIDKNITSIGSASNINNIINGNEYDRSMRSWFGRINYAYRDRYLFEGNLRYDGSSKFAPRTRWGFFPSFSAGWRLSEEAFLESLKESFQQLKLRASWGKLGNNASGEYDYQALYNGVNYSFNNTVASALATTKIGNPALMWESTAITDIGLEGTTLKGNLSFEVDYYRKLTTGILTTPPIALTVGTASAPTANTASVLNKGIELTIGYGNKIGEVSFNVTGNIAYNKNEVVGYKGKLQEGYITDAAGNKTYSSNLGSVSSSDNNKWIVEGHQINEYYLFDVYKGNGARFNADGSVNKNGGPKDGMIRTDEDMAWLNGMIAAGYSFLPSGATGKGKLWYGDLIYADANGDGIYGNNYDRTFSGSSGTPKYNFGLSANVSWRGVDFSMIWTGSTGSQFYYNDRGYLSSVTSAGNAIGLMVADDHYYYNDANPNDPANNIDGKYPRLKLNTDAQNSQVSRFYLFNAAYAKLKNMQVGYTISPKAGNRLPISKARIFVSGENLLTITKYPGLDPEMGAGVGYPTMKQYAMGVNVTF
jgi:TonB-linked SusC/RagA family outer membrane protein